MVFPAGLGRLLVIQYALLLGATLPRAHEIADDLVRVGDYIGSDLPEQIERAI